MPYTTHLSKFKYGIQPHSPWWQVLPKSYLRRLNHAMFLLSYRNTENMFFILLQNTTTQKPKWTCLLWSSKCKFSLMPSLCQQLVLVISFYWVIEAWFLTNQCAYIFALGYFLITHKSQSGITVTVNLILRLLI